MSKFEFIMMFVSVVVAFAMAELMMGWGRLLRARHRIKNAGLLVGWSIWLLAITNFHYLGFWEYSVVDFHNAGQMLLFLFAPTILVLATFILTPEIRHYQRLDLEQHYFRIKNWFFATAILFLLAAAGADALLPDFQETWQSRLIGNMVIIPSLIWLMLSDRRSVHLALLGLNLLLLFWSSYTINVRAL
ncbi:MAG: hypothetical protein RQ757_08850 [Pseudomonadales bacterium]|nr:hypothetical protein [Pseudomonadales bacterium]